MRASGRPLRAALVTVMVAASVGCGTTNPAAVGGVIAATAAADIAASAISAAANRAAGASPTPNEPDHLREPRPLDVEHARAVLLETDVAACWPAGPHSADSVQVTFRSNGTVVRVGVTRPTRSDSPMLDARCVSERLRDVIIDPFLGDEAVVTVTYGDP